MNPLNRFYLDRKITKVLKTAGSIQNPHIGLFGLPHTTTIIIIIIAIINYYTSLMLQNTG